MKSYYDILGVSKFASDDEIRKAFILRSKMIHPDRFDQSRQKEEWKLANEMFQELNHAYGVLKDPVSRSLYDRSSGGSHTQQSSPPPQSSSHYSNQPRREAQTPPPRKKPQYNTPQKSGGADIPEWIKKIIRFVIGFAVIAMIGKACESEKKYKAPSTPSNLSAGTSYPATAAYTPPLVYNPPLIRTPAVAPSPVQSIPPDYPEPANGFVFKNRFASGGHGKLQITNGCSSHSVVKLVDVALNKAVYAGFVRANSVLNISGIPDGTYRLLFAAGHGWDDIDGRFKQREGSSEFREPLLYTSTPITRDGHRWIQYDTMTITLNPVVGGNAKTDSISTSDFEKY